MSQHERYRKATLELDSDGFSIHTFELAHQLSHEKYQKIRDFFFELQAKSADDAKTYEYDYIARNDDGSEKEKRSILRCTAFSDNGVTMSLEHNIGKKNGFVSYYLRIFVSPRRLIEPGSSYLGILAPTPDSIDKVAEKFREMFQDTIVPNNINDYHVARIDLCVNIRCDYKKLFREMLRVSRKMPAPPKFERKYRTTNTKGLNKAAKQEAKREDAKYNKHYLKWQCKSYELVIYDKTYQIRNFQADVDEEEYKYSVLRCELRLFRRVLRKIEKDCKLDSTKKLLKNMIQTSSEYLPNTFCQHFPTAHYRGIEDIERIIKQSDFQNDTKSKMIDLSKRLQRTQTVDKALAEMRDEGIVVDKKDILDHFRSLKINPVPLWKKFCAKEIPSVPMLLCRLKEGPRSIDYTLKK